MVLEFARDVHVWLHLTCEGLDKEGCHKSHWSVTQKSGGIFAFSIKLWLVPLHSYLMYRSWELEEAKIRANRTFSYSKCDTGQSASCHGDMTSVILKEHP